MLTVLKSAEAIEHGNWSNKKYEPKLRTLLGSKEGSHTNVLKLPIEMKSVRKLEMWNLLLKLMLCTEQLKTSKRWDTWQGH